MKENNEVADQALQTLSLYVEGMNKDIIASFDLFRAALDIEAKDYEQYMVYPPKDPRDIDITQPTVQLVQEKKETPAAISEPVKAEEEATSAQTEEKADTDSDADKKESETVEENAASETSEDKKKIDEPVKSETTPTTQETDATNNLSQNSLEEIMQLAQIGVGGVALTPQADVASHDEKTNSLDIVDQDFTLEQNTDDKPLPDVQTLVLTENSDAMPSAIEKALNTDIDNNIATISVKAPDTRLTVAEQAKMVTEDIAEQLNNIKPEVRDEVPTYIMDEEQRALKVNPVVAMDIGKSDENETLASVSWDNVKKSGFSKVTDTKEIKPFPQHKTKNTLANILKVDNVSVAMQNTPQEVTLNTSNNEEQNAKYVFHQQTKELSFVGNVGKTMLIGKEDKPALSIVPKKYVFNALNNAELPFYGEACKNMAKGKVQVSDEPVMLNRYVFAANDSETTFSGDVGKRMFLGVK